MRNREERKNFNFRQKMQFRCVLVSCLLSVTLLQWSISGVRVDLRPPQRIDRSMSRTRTVAVKGEELTAKLLRLDHMVQTENDVMEPKKKRSFPGNSAPLDRLSVSSMETKQGSNKHSKVVESPRRRVNPPPIDRIGTSGLPGRG